MGMHADCGHGIIMAKHGSITHASHDTALVSYKSNCFGCSVDSIVSVCSCMFKANG